MKKKTVKLLLAVLVSLMICGCGAVTDEPEAEDEDIVEEDDEDEDEDDPEESDEPDRPDDHSSSEEYLLVAWNEPKDLYVMDEKGDVLYEIDRKAIQDSLGDVDENKYSVYSEHYTSSNPVCSGDGFLFFEDFVSDDGSSYHPIVYAVGGIADGNYKLYPLWEGNAAERVRGLDFYKGSLYLDIILGYDKPDISGYREFIYTYDEKADSFSGEESHDLDAVFEKTVSADMSIEGQGRAGSTLTYCYRRTLDDCGFILAGKENYLAAVDESGKVLKTIDTGKKLYNFYYDSGNLFYIDTDYTNHLYSILVIDVKTGKETQIGETICSTQLTGAQLLSSAGDKFFYVTYEYDEFGIRVHRVYVYDATEGSNIFLYEERTVPGSGVMPGSERFTPAGEYLYYLGFDDGNIVWMRRSISDASVPEKTGIVLSHIDFFDLGTVSYKSNTYVCPDCGTDLVMKYSEYFILDDKYSDHASEINDFLEQEAVQTVDWETDYHESSCTDHSERPTFYQVTTSFEIASACIIDDRYLTVDMSGFWYGGGASGYSPEKQYLFDLETGENLTIKDFYTGSEKEFIDLVVRKTVEDFGSYDQDSSPYYAWEGYEIEDEARRYVSVDGFIRFSAEGIYYCYTPGTIGYLPVGYIEVLIPYEDLLGRETLKA
ncbi:MAG: hypothetical protein J5696_00215 [Lachnospiraceae bacterium]|nr:hypothetical protein [Lachnospiraceae bacterium]